MVEKYKINLPDDNHPSLCKICLTVSVTVEKSYTDGGTKFYPNDKIQDG